MADQSQTFVLSSTLNSVALGGVNRPDFESYVQELQTFLDQFPRQLKQRLDADFDAQCRKLVERFPSLGEEGSIGTIWIHLRQALADVQRALEARSPRREILACHARAARCYERWLRNMRKAAKSKGEKLPESFGSLKPLIGARTAFHILTGVLAMVCYQFFLSRAQATGVLVSLLAIFAALEVSRRQWPAFNDFLLGSRLFKPIARPHEYDRINSSTYYLLALCLVTPLFAKPAVLMAIAILAFADPAAAWFGKRYGRKKIFGAKSYVGSLAFFVTGCVVAGGVLLAFYPQFSGLQKLMAVCISTLCATTAEACSKQIDDNLTIPLAATLGAALFL